ncbi:hypothetical protein [Microseira wollei]|uniref:Uncharacterized protein n=1 Tax=Microseira wollei NIES-4236 TaxID=2530354 RepID=A0AAV3X168_9CYAN|nr:hypothetical protein [Microseira wollei]GET35525.1 hypothetical protein MiSe_02670 [Microseira wollei NIES-4236]
MPLGIVKLYKRLLSVFDMDTSFSRIHLIGGLIAGATVAEIAFPNPITTLTQFSPEIPESTRSSISRSFLTPSILARGMKPKSTRRRYEVPSPPRRGVPGGGS